MVFFYHQLFFLIKFVCLDLVNDDFDSKFSFKVKSAGPFNSVCWFYFFNEHNFDQKNYRPSQPTLNWIPNPINWSQS
jgi:hypothetical protein